MIYRYFLVVVACLTLLVGIQVPNFVDQYEKRLDAHFIEVANNLQGFQEIADRHFGGSLEALIAKHETSDDTVFHDEARPIRKIHARYLRFKAEKEALDTELPGKVAYLLTYGDRELLSETYNDYSFALLLNKASVLSGLVTVTIVLLVIELLRMIGLLVFRRRAPLSV
jgi:hypothetical protein